MKQWIRWNQSVQNHKAQKQTDQREAGEEDEMELEGEPEKVGNSRQESRRVTTGLTRGVWVEPVVLENYYFQ